MNWLIVFFKGQTHSFVPFVVAIHSTLFPLPLDPGNWFFREKGTERGIGHGEGGIAVIRCTETKRGGSWAEFREWTLSKGTVDGILHPLPHPSCQCIVEPDTFHYVLLCPMDILFARIPSFRVDSQIELAKAPAIFARPSSLSTGSSLFDYRFFQLMTTFDKLFNISLLM